MKGIKIECVDMSKFTGAPERFIVVATDADDDVERFVNDNVLGTAVHEEQRRARWVGTPAHAALAMRELADQEAIRLTNVDWYAPVETGRFDIDENNEFVIRGVY